ncbi:hypothetical protein HFP72_05825 [Nocardiopsis sp. ARC36]
MEEMTRIRRVVGCLVVSTSMSLAALGLGTTTVGGHWLMWALWAWWGVLAAVTVWAVVMVHRIGSRKEYR